MGHHEHHHITLDRLLHSKLSSLYIFQAINIFVKSMIGIFAAAYMYLNGYELYEVFLYSTLMPLAIILIMPLTVKIISKYGFKIAIMISVPVYIGFILCLNYIYLHPIFAIFTWILFGFHVGIFWPAYHSEFVISSHKNKRSSEVGTIQIITTMVATLAPFIGGLLLQFMSFLGVLIVGCGLLLISFIPLAYSKNGKLKNVNFGYKNYIDFIKNKSNRNSKNTFIAESFEHTASFEIWPLFLFIILGASYAVLGGVMTGVSIISIIIIKLIKDKLDKQDKEKFLKKTAKYFSFAWILRSLTILIGGIFVFITETISRIVIDMYRLPYFSIFYNNAKSDKYLEYIIMREFFLSIIKIPFLLVISLILFFTGESIIVMSLIIIIAAISSYFIGNYKEIIN